MKRIVLFGAGASYGAGRVYPKVPPLGKDLYAELARYSLAWRNLPDDIQSGFQGGFEQGMQVLWDKYSHSISPLMQHMTLYLAQFRPDGSKSDLYTRFFDALGGQTAFSLISTLNYDCLLELAAVSLGKRVHYWNSEAPSGSLKVWKLHGSCNFLSAGVQATKGMSFSSGVFFDSGLKAVNPNDAIQYCLSNNSLYPAMALYMTAKPIQIGQSVILDLQKRWGELVHDAERVLVIGVRPYPPDTHIWQPLADFAGELGFIGQEVDLRHWQEAHRSGKPTRLLGPRWDACFAQTVAFIRE